MARKKTDTKAKSDQTAATTTKKKVSPATRTKKTSAKKTTTSGIGALSTRFGGNLPSFFAWDERRTDRVGHTIALVISFVFAYFILWVVPFAYDQLNLSFFQTAANNKTLIIQEFKGAGEKVIVDECSSGGTKCDIGILYDRLKNIKIISLDYVSQMNNTKSLSYQNFITSLAFQLVFVGILVGLISAAIKSYAMRFLCLFSVFLVIIIGFHVITDLPHSNLKFYYIFGCIYALILSIGDFFQRIDILRDIEYGVNQSAISEAIKERHKKWSSIFGFTVAFFFTLVGSISFNLLDYITIVFGESFIFYPLIGIVISIVYSLIIMYWWVVRNLLMILSELEVRTSQITAEN